MLPIDRADYLTDAEIETYLPHLELIYQNVLCYSRGLKGFPHLMDDAIAARLGISSPAIVNALRERAKVRIATMILGTRVVRHDQTHTKVAFALSRLINALVTHDVKQLTAEDRSTLAKWLEVST